MLFLVTHSICSDADAIVQICEQRMIEVFRLNVDLYPYYQFLWDKSGIKITDPTGRAFDSNQMDCCAIYKAALIPDGYAPIDDILPEETAWTKSTINSIVSAISVWGISSNKLKLWVTSEYLYPKTKQMSCASEYFLVPEYRITWGMQGASRKVIAKTLIQKKFSDQRFAYARLVDQSDLDPRYPWFTQEAAEGNRDATVVYINGHVHCYQFATERGALTDWRVTQGTENNKWEPWDAGSDFEKRVDAYMKELGLKFGRLDFIIGGKEPEFLEVNPCGQFGWLDDEKLTLHNEVVDAILDPSSTIG